MLRKVRGVWFARHRYHLGLEPSLPQTREIAGRGRRRFPLTGGHQQSHPAPVQSRQRRFPLWHRSRPGSDGLKLLRLGQPESPDSLHSRRLGPGEVHATLRNAEGLSQMLEQQGQVMFAPCTHRAHDDPPSLT